MRENIHVMDHEKVIRDKYNALMESLSVLRALTSLPVEMVDERGLVRDALLSLIQNHDMQACSVFLLEGKQLVNVTGMDWQEVHAQSPGLVRSSIAQRFQLGEGIIGLAAKSGSMQRCDDCQNSPHFKQDDSQPIPGSVICTPIEHSGQTIGVLNVSHPEPNFFEDWHTRMLTIYASTLGLLIHNNRLLHSLEDQIQSRSQELENALDRARELKIGSEEAALKDELTGLYTRRFFFPQAESALARAIRYKQHFSVMLIDVDYFRNLNANFGHTVGDMVLQDIAEVIRDVCRDSDILARYAGEEFILAVPDTDAQGALLFAERIAKGVRQLKWSHDGERLASTVCIGIASLDVDAWDKAKTNIDELLTQAEEVIYEIRGEGRGQIRVYRPND